MKLHIANFSEEYFREQLAPYHLDLSVFLDVWPQDASYFSTINIMVLQEPDEYFGFHRATLANRQAFTHIFTWDDYLLNNCDNASFQAFGGTWFSPEMYAKPIPKSFRIAHLAGATTMTYGKQIRHEILNRQQEVRTPTKFYLTYGDRMDIPKAAVGKVEVFGDCQYGVCIENTSHNGYFTEKILDCFLLRVIPMYWGCSDIGRFFNAKGIIKFENADDFIAKANALKETDYDSYRDVIEENYQLALQYVDYQGNVVRSIKQFIERGLKI